MKLSTNKNCDADFPRIQPSRRARFRVRRFLPVYPLRRASFPACEWSTVDYTIAKKRPRKAVFLKRPCYNHRLILPHRRRYCNRYYWATFTFLYVDQRRSPSFMRRPSATMAKSSRWMVFSDTPCMALTASFIEILSLLLNKAIMSFLRLSVICPLLIFDVLMSVLYWGVSFCPLKKPKGPTGGGWS